MIFPPVAPEERCPCESGAVARRCCFRRGQFKPQQHRPPFRARKSGEVRKRCYAGQFRDCHGPLSSEHPISANILRRLDAAGRLHVRGFPRPTDEWTSLPVQALGSNILCQRHNADLSGLDEVGGRVVDHLETVAREFDEGGGKSWLWGLNGHDLERWLLKTLCGLLSAGWARAEEGKQLARALPERWLEILYGRRTFPSTWGLYVSGTIGERPQAESNLFGFAAVSTGDDVAGLQAFFVGQTFTLLMSDVPDLRAGAIDHDAIYRPRYLRHEGGGVEKIIYFHWDELSPLHAGVTSTWSPRARGATERFGVGG